MKRLEWLIGKIIVSKLRIHVLFCLVFIAAFALSLVFSGNMDATFAGICVCIFILLCTYAGRWCGKTWIREGTHTRFLLRLFIVLISLSVVGAAGSTRLFRGDMSSYFLQYLTVNVPMVSLFVFFGIAATLARNSLLRQVHEAKLVQQQKESELKMLLSQLSPHFLFNTLNNIYGISITRQEQVPNLLLKLSALLRYSVYETREPFIPLKNEVSYITNYLHFEKIQTGDKLNLESDLPDITDGDVLIAPMLLIVFVENAFKHSKNTRDNKIFIAVSLKVQDNWILFSIRNSYSQTEYQPDGFDEAAGIGLGHTLKRLELIYGKDYFYQTQKENGVYEVELRIKVRRK